MVVKEVMVSTPITISMGQSLQEAQDLMVSHSIRHLPVVEEKTLLGIITESDIRNAFVYGDKSTKAGSGNLTPSRMKVEDHMTEQPLTASPETNIEDAALLIYRNKIGALPIVDKNKLVGIISIMDILGLFIDMMGILHSSSRVDVVMNKDQKNFEKVSGLITEVGLNIISVAMSPYPQDKSKQVYFFRLDLCDTSAVVEKIQKEGFKVLSAID